MFYLIFSSKAKRSCSDDGECWNDHGSQDRAVVCIDLHLLVDGEFLFYIFHVKEMCYFLFLVFN